MLSTASDVLTYLRAQGNTPTVLTLVSGRDTISFKLHKPRNSAPMYVSLLKSDSLGMVFADEQGPHGEFRYGLGPKSRNLQAARTFQWFWDAVRGGNLPGNGSGGTVQVLIPGLPSGPIQREKVA